METSLPTPTTARVYVNLPEGIHLSLVPLFLFSIVAPISSQVRGGSLVFYQDAGYQDVDSKARYTRFHGYKSG